MAEAQASQWSVEDVARAYDLAFAPDLPEYYGNIYYTSGTSVDIRIAVGKLRPRSSVEAAVTIDKFEASFTMPLIVAKQLANQILTMVAANEALTK